MTLKQSDAKRQRLKNLIEAADEALDVLIGIDEELDGPMAMPSPLTVRLAHALEECKGVFTCYTCQREDVGPATWTERYSYRSWRTRKVGVRQYCAACAPAAEEKYERMLEYQHDAERDLARDDDVDNERGRDDEE